MPTHHEPGSMRSILPAATDWVAISPNSNAASHRLDIPDLLFDCAPVNHPGRGSYKTLHTFAADAGAAAAGC
jgi:hypothetical protein